MAPSAAAWTAAVLAVGSLAVFVWMQFASIANRDFLLLVFSSFFFLGVATILALGIYRGSSITQKALAVAVAITLIIGTVFVLESLTPNIMRGGYASTFITLEDFVLNMSGDKVDDHLQYIGAYSKVIHKPSYASYEITLDTSPFGHDSSFEVTLLAPANVNGTCYIYFALKPYELNYYPLLREEAIFTENSTSRVFDVHVYPMWGGDSHVRFEDYTIEFTLQLILTGAETGPSALNFTVNSQGEINIGEAIVSSTFQSNLNVALCGGFVGANILVPGTFTFHLLSRKRKKKEIDKQE
jgi:hypothetical protein